MFVRIKIKSGQVCDTKFRHLFNDSITRQNKPGTAQVGATLEFQKNEIFFKYAQKDTIVKILSIYSAKKIPKEIRIRLENEFPPTGNNKKHIFWEKFHRDEKPKRITIKFADRFFFQAKNFFTK